jgi:hypothetical protein
MITTSAACGLILVQPGAANTTSFSGGTGRFSEPVKCAHCDAEYRLEYALGEIDRIQNYESRLRAEAQKKVNADHPPDPNPIGHTRIIGVLGLQE